MRTLALLTAAAAVGLAAAATPAAARVSVTITSARVITADSRVPVKPPYRRERAYAYMIRYRITGAGTVTVRRRAVVRTRGGTLIARIAPPDSREESGAYFASARIPIGRRDPIATYVLGYSIEVRGAGGRDRASRVLRMPFV